jgi:SpoVK/Ycf46/Vps4 family AAA+-type ATPase
MWLGGSEAKLKERFAAAREAAKSGPCVLFMDELDALGLERRVELGGSAPSRILSTLLGFLDDVQKTLSNVIILGATNRVDALDPGLTRPGRLDLKITVPRPNRAAAATILSGYLDQRPIAAASVPELVGPILSQLYSPRGEYAELVRVRLNDGRQLTYSAAELVSGAVLEHVVRRAAEEAAYRQADTGDPASITLDDLTLSVEQELLELGSLLTPGNVKSYVQKVPRDAHPVDVTLTPPRIHRYLRAS